MIKKSNGGEDTDSLAKFRRIIAHVARDESVNPPSERHLQKGQIVGIRQRNGSRVGSDMFSFGFKAA
jgi:hypothetical protein